MFRLLFYLVIGYALYQLIKSFLRKTSKEIPRRTGEVQTFQDPVCGVYVTREDAVTEKIGGERFYFCSIDCLEKYRQDYENTSSHANESGGRT